MLSICCLSETVAVSLIGAERIEMPDGELRELLTKIYADEVRPDHCRAGATSWRWSSRPSSENISLPDCTSTSTPTPVSVPPISSRFPSGLNAVAAKGASDRRRRLVPPNLTYQSIGVHDLVHPDDQRHGGPQGRPAWLTSETQRPASRCCRSPASSAGAVCTASLATTLGPPGADVRTLGGDRGRLAGENRRRSEAFREQPKT